MRMTLPWYAARRTAGTAGFASDQTTIGNADPKPPLTIFARMLILTACVLANVALAVCFKLFPRLGMDTFTAIVINYWVSMGLGSAIAGHIPILHHQLDDTPWAWFAIAIGFVFVIGFTTIGQSVKHVGMTITTAMQKMSLLIPTAYALIVYHEHAGPVKLAGIVLSVVAIILVTKKDDIRWGEFRKLLPYLFLPFGALVFSGIIESILYHIQIEDLATHGDVAFTTYGFSVAAIIGTIVLIWRQVTGKHQVTWRDVAGGVVLGTPNFFSIYLILVLLKNGFPGSVLYPVLNILILCLTAITGLFVFREKLKPVNIIGIVLAVISILLVSAREIMQALD